MPGLLYCLPAEFLYPVLPISNPSFIQQIKPILLPLKFFTGSPLLRIGQERDQAPSTLMSVTFLQPPSPPSDLALPALLSSLLPETPSSFSCTSLSLLLCTLCELAQASLFQQLDLGGPRLGSAPRHLCAPTVLGSCLSCTEHISLEFSDTSFVPM